MTHKERKFLNEFFNQKLNVKSDGFTNEIWGNNIDYKFPEFTIKYSKGKISIVLYSMELNDKNLESLITRMKVWISDNEMKQRHETLNNFHNMYEVFKKRQLIK